MNFYKSYSLVAVIFLSACSTTSSKSEFAEKSVERDISSLPEFRPFTSDACSLFPQGTLLDEQAWQHCCVKHDVAYWVGGTKEERLKADQELKACVEKSGHPYIARAMKWGVRMGGIRSPFSFRWGYGWKGRRPYGPLNEQEKMLVARYWPLVHLPMYIRKTPRIDPIVELSLEDKEPYLSIKKHLDVHVSQNLERPRVVHLRDFPATYQLYTESCAGGYFLFHMEAEEGQYKVLKVDTLGECQNLK